MMHGFGSHTMTVAWHSIVDAVPWSAVVEMLRLPDRGCVLSPVIMPAKLKNVTVADGSAAVNGKPVTAGQSIKVVMPGVAAETVCAKLMVAVCATKPSVVRWMPDTTSKWNGDRIADPL
jgi:hypothetical protein